MLISAWFPIIARVNDLFTMKLLWVVLLIVKNTQQISNPNCVRDNPEILHAGFKLFNSFSTSDFRKEFVIKHVTLFSTRFKHGHEFGAISGDLMKFIGEGVSQYINSSKKFVKLFFTSETVDLALGRDTNNDIEEAIDVYKDVYVAVQKVNSGSKDLVIGVYIHRLLNSFMKQLEAVLSVFGPRQNPKILIGYKIDDCFKQFRATNNDDPSILEYLQRMDFICCLLFPQKKSSPEKSAEEIIKTCDRLRDFANSIAITAEVRCLVSYPSYGSTATGIQGSISGFRKFWCKIVDILVREKFHAQIILDSAFDDTPDLDSTTALNDLHNAEFHGGWWKRRHLNSYDTSAFLEKVEELEVGRENGNCTAECGSCDSKADCCGGKSCHLDYSFQPFENVQLQKVCQSKNTKCAPRHPKTPDSSSGVSPQTNSLPSNATIIELSSSSSEGTSGIFFITVVVLLSAIFLVAIFVAFFFYRRGKPLSVLKEEELREFFHGTSSLTSELEQGHEVVCTLPYDTGLEVKKNFYQIYEDKILGSGAFGVVVKGRVGNVDVAVKTTLPGVNASCLKALLMELKILMHLGKHENVVNIVGAHTSELNSGKLYLFLELCSFGNLLHFLRDHREDFSVGSYEACESRLTCKNLFQWSIQISGAMEHLVEKKVIHADIAARNILVFSNNHVKLTDFGLSRRLYQYANYVKNNQEPLPWRHMAIEALRDFTISCSSDVWSFGVTLWEMFSLGNIPYPGYSLSLDFIQLLLDGLRLECPEYAHPLMYEVMISCWTKDAESRPPIALIRSKLSSVLDELYTNQLYVSASDIKITTSDGADGYELHNAVPEIMQNLLVNIIRTTSFLVILKETP